ncbi:hypothetical protein LDK93_08165 [Staphylococcus pasteuri]|uniref:hypothetical protein n=1 Tax=Staphylococcus pasteuri TaxID=45972 RepID=UPI001E56B49A|nr:hypothetical protein [Staphylococcus pasteuri]MCD9067001.1 hypothetical protein [Staphylococcus pasteuri]MDI3231582.1 hypothetical protein [Staphylococcus pasteuri]
MFKLRPTLLILFIILNALIIVISLNNDLTVQYFSLRVILAAFSFVLSLFFLLIRTTQFSMYLSITSIIIVVVHIAIIIQSAYTYLY